MGTSLFGNQAWAVRLPFLLLAGLSCALVVRGVFELSGRAAAVWALWLVCSIPLFAANGLLALPDVPLNLAVILCLYGLQRALRGATAAGPWLALGLAVGFLSHYRFAVPLLAAGLWLLASREGRRLLTEPRLLAWSFTGSALGLAPLVWQQWQSSGAGLSFQFADRHPWSFQPAHLLDPLPQALLTSPLLWAALLFSAFWALRSRLGAALRMHAALALILLLLYLGLGAFADAERSRMHWTLPAYLALIAPLATQWSQSNAAALVRWRRLALGLAGLWLAAGLGYLLVIARSTDSLARWQLYPSNFSGAETAAERVAQSLRQLPADTLIAADQFMLAAQLQFLLSDRQVYSLNHPLNIKHGRQTVLSALGRDEKALFAEHRDRPLLIVSELSASRLRQRPEHYRDLCRRFPAGRLLWDVSVDHGHKRYIAWWDPRRLESGDGDQVPDHQAGRANGRVSCLPPPLLYIDQPGWNAEVALGTEVSGWAIRGRVGIDRLRARIGDIELPVRYGQPIPSLVDILPGLNDPNMPGVGFVIELDAVPAGRQWLIIEASSTGQQWVTVEQWPLRVIATQVRAP